MHPVEQILSIVAFNTIVLAAYALTFYYHGHQALIGIPTFSVIVYGAFLYHCRRDFKAIMDMSLEKDAQDQGPSVLTLFGFRGRLTKPSII